MRRWLRSIRGTSKAVARTTSGGFGFGPMFCFADGTGEALAAVLRPGNAGANAVVDHLLLLDQAIGQLPAPVSCGHHVGDDPAVVRRSVQVRTDSAGCSNGFVFGCRARNVGFAVVARTNASIHTAISRIHACDPDKRWQPARRRTGDPAQRSEVAEITDLVDLSGWPEGTRMIVRREQLHQGAQRSLFPSLCHRYWGHYTDNTGTPVELDAHMRDHAHVEDHIKRLKDSVSSGSRSPISTRTGHGCNSCACPPISSAAISSCAAPANLPSLNRNGCAGPYGTHPPGSCAKPGATSSASSTAGPPPTISSEPTNASTRSADTTPSTTKSAAPSPHAPQHRPTTTPDTTIDHTDDRHTPTSTTNHNRTLRNNHTRSTHEFS